MTNSNITRAQSDWAKQIEELERVLADLRPQLVEREAELADKLAAINSFEYQIRVRLGGLLNKLEDLDKEIQAIRKKLLWLGDNWDAQEEDLWKMGDSATAEGEYRYRAKPEEQRERELSKDEAAELKKLYRDLARRFHPDMAVDEADREYRTQLMMAINAAYAAGDLAKLQEIAAEPDSMSNADLSSNEQLQAEALQRELARIHRRLREIEDEMARLEKTNTSRMMRQATVLESEGDDFFAEKEDELKDQISFKKVERDSLQTQLDSFEADSSFTGDEFADAVWDVTLDQKYDDNAAAPDFEKYIKKRQDGVYFEEDFDDDIDYD